LELIHKTIIKILDIGIKLEDAQAVNKLASQQALEEQQDMMDRSMASLGLHTPRRGGERSFEPSKSMNKSMQMSDSSSEDDEKEANVDLSILSSTWDGGDDEIVYGERLKTMKGDFDRLVRFVASGLKGVARAAGGEEARSWDLLGEMLESGLNTRVMNYQ
jgi:gamma-tubulin complex component 5